MPPSAVSPPSVTLRNASIRFAGASLFEGLSLRLAAGRITALLGESGCGKSSLLRLLAGLPPPDRKTVWEGEARLEGEENAVRSTAGGIALMEQSNPLLPWLSARANITIGARLRGETPDVGRADALLDALGLKHKADALPGALSGGMRQRVSLARALYEPAAVVLMDEPFAALDALTRWRLQRVAVGLLAGRTCLLVTHDPLEALCMGDAILLMKGAPARLESIAVPPLAPPRDLQNRETQQCHAALLARLAS